MFLANSVSWEHWVICFEDFQYVTSLIWWLIVWANLGRVVTYTCCMALQPSQWNSQRCIRNKCTPGSPTHTAIYSLSCLTTAHSQEIHTKCNVNAFPHTHTNKGTRQTTSPSKQNILTNVVVRGRRWCHLNLFLVPPPHPFTLPLLKLQEIN